MPKRRKKIDTKQMLIPFDQLSKKHDRTYQSIKKAIKPPATGSFACMDNLRAAIHDAIKNCDMDVYEIAGQMSSLMDETITKDKIYSWTRRSDEINGRARRSIPARCLPAFCKVTGDTRPIEVLMELVGLVVVPTPEAIEVEMGKNEKMINELKRQNQKFTSLLYEMGQLNG